MRLPAFPIWIQIRDGIQGFLKFEIVFMLKKHTSPMSIEVCSQAHKLWMCTLEYLMCTDSRSETMQDRGLEKKTRMF